MGVMIKLVIDQFRIHRGGRGRQSALLPVGHPLEREIRQCVVHGWYQKNPKPLRWSSSVSTLYGLTYRRVPRVARHGRVLTSRDSKHLSILGLRGYAQGNPRTGEGGRI